MARIAIAGATGFVGSALIDVLKQEHEIIALTRGAIAEDPENSKTSHGINWRRCDLFSLLQTEQALQGVDYAIYLVHSMLPSAELSQGSFQDWDLLAADNFARACEKNGIKQIIYLGGIIPRDASLSPHLESRLEVEKVLGASSVPLTAFRAAIVIGHGSSSLAIMERLVRRLPVMLCPKWTVTKSRPVSIRDVVTAIATSLAHPKAMNRVFDLGGPDALTYRELMLAVAESLGLKRFAVSVPVVTPGLSRLWVSSVTGAPKNLVAPLIESLRHEMLPSSRNEYDLNPSQAKSVKVSLDEALHKEKDSSRPRAFELPSDERQIHYVQSVQRLPRPASMDAAQVAREYQQWLPRLLWPVLDVQNTGKLCTFCLRFFKTPLLILARSEERSYEGRVLFYIVGGLLAGDDKNGRLEFREAFHGNNILAAVHDFRPALPWFIYKYTQAFVHLWVMKSFERHLEKLA